MKSMFKWLAAAVLIIPHITNAQVSIQPNSPKELETVRVRLPLGTLGLDVNGRPDTYDERGTTLTMSNNKITVSLLMKGNDGFPRNPELDWPIGQLPPGAYEVEVVKRSTSGVNEGLVGRATFTVQPREASGALFDFTDLYYDPAEPGWGVSVTQIASGGLFLIWFLYDADGKPVWYFVPEGEWVQGSLFRGPAYRSTGTDFSRPYDPSQFRPVAVGTAEIAFSAKDYEAAAFSSTLDGKAFVKLVKRQRL